MPLLRRTATAIMPGIPAPFESALRRFDLVEGSASIIGVPLAGGVSSEIWRVNTNAGPVCVKRALAQLKVAADWRAPVSRNAYEVAWFKTAGAIVPDAVPRIIGHDPKAGLFVMDYLDPVDHRVWKADLRAGQADPTVGATVGDRLARIHAGTAGRNDVAEHFATDELFHALRLSPYLEAAAACHPDRADALAALVHVTAAEKRALVHGDVSPKNILLGPRGPVFIDAECAWYGDPAFDLAFCLNHLLLKCLWTPVAREGFLAVFEAMAAAYWAGVTWEPVADLERRAARLLPGLMLARVDGKSPVEYVTEESDQNSVRRVARSLLADPAGSVAEVAEAWRAELGH